MENLDKYLKPTAVIDWDNKAVKWKARELTQELQTDREKAVALFYFVRDGIKHNPYAPPTGS
jgi:transglutaminase-like putative cysteine protease